MNNRPSRQTASWKLGRRTPQVESLEGRRLLTAATVQPIETHFAMQVVAGYVAEVERAALPGHSEAEFTKFGSAAEAQAALESYVDAYWADLFGRELDQQLLEQYGYFYRPIIDAIWRDNMLFSARQHGFLLGASGDDRAGVGLTNVQVAGVDEGDQIEVVDGSYLYATTTLGYDFYGNAPQSRVEIIDIRDPSRLTVVGSIEVAGYRPNIMVNGNRLVVVSFDGVQVFDVADKAQPRLLMDAKLDGTIKESRIVDGKLILQSDRSFQLPEPLFFPAETSSDTTSPSNQLFPSMMWTQSHGQLHDTREVFEIPAIWRPTPDPIEGSLGRFESRDAYLARVADSLLAEFLPDITFAGAEATRVEIGDWADLAQDKNGFSTRQSSVLVIDIHAEVPRVLDSEVVAGFESDFVFAEDDSVYLIDVQANRWWSSEYESSTDIYRISILNTGDGVEAVIDAAGSVNGSVAGSWAMDEHAGDLRVVADDHVAQDTHATNLHVLRASDGRLEAIGRLLDMADGQAHFGTLFQGDVAFVTTAEMVDGRPLIDPLHVIDLSDPTQPIERSELVIPGVSSHLQAVGPNLLVGIGFVEVVPTTSNADRTRPLIWEANWRLQVSLYDVSDAENPRTIVAQQVDGVSFFGPSAQVEALAVHFEPETGVLTVSDGLLPWGTNFGVLAYRIDPQAADPNVAQPLVELGRLNANERVVRSFVVDGDLFGVGESRLVAAPLGDLNAPYDELVLAQGARNDRVHVLRGHRQYLTVLDNDRLPASSRITGVSESTIGARVSIAPDGQSLIYLANNTRETSDRLTYTVTLSDGSTATADVHIEIENVTAVVVHEPNDHNVQIGVSLVDELGNAVRTAQVGDRVWVEISATEDGPGRGIFQASFGVQFDPAMLQVVTAPEAVGAFSGGVSVIESRNGFEELSAYSSSIAPLGDGPHTVFRFEVEVLQAGRIEIAATPQVSIGKEFLVYDMHVPVWEANIFAGTATLLAQSPLQVAGNRTDVNGDGSTTPIDVLWVVNFLNQGSLLNQGQVATVSRSVTAAEGESQEIAIKCDVNGDGLVSPLDILQIVNRLNAERTAGGEGEGSMDESTVVDAIMLTYDIDDPLLRKSGQGRTR